MLIKIFKIYRFLGQFKRILGREEIERKSQRRFIGQLSELTKRQEGFSWFSWSKKRETERDRERQRETERARGGREITQRIEHEQLRENERDQNQRSQER